MGINRRKFLKGAAVTAAASTVFSPHSFAQSGNVRWRCASSFPKSLDTIFGGASTVAERVAAMTDGKFQIRAYEAGELVPGLQVLDAVQQGTVECGHTCGYYFVGKDATLGFATSVPFGLSVTEQNAWMYHGGGMALLREVYGQFGVINFPAGNTGAQMGGWWKQEVKTAAQLRGKKVRIPGLGGQVMAKLGANVQVIPGGEIYLALDRGAIDAAEWVGPYDDEKLGLHKAAKFYYYPGWWEPGPNVDFIVNQKQYNALPKAYREILATACAEANVTMMAEYDAKNQAALVRLQRGGTQLRRFSNDILAAANKATQDLHAENSAKNAGYKKVYTQWNGFRASVRNWHQVNEKAMMDFKS